MTTLSTFNGRVVMPKLEFEPNREDGAAIDLR
jgi:hypothetical protein